MLTNIYYLILRYIIITKVITIKRWYIINN